MITISRSITLTYNNQFETAIGFPTLIHFDGSGVGARVTGLDHWHQSRWRLLAQRRLGTPEGGLRKTWMTSLPLPTIHDNPHNIMINNDPMIIYNHPYTSTYTSIYSYIYNNPWWSMCYMMIKIYVIYVKVPFHCVPFRITSESRWAPGGLGGLKWQGDCQLGIDGAHQWLATCGLKT